MDNAIEKETNRDRDEELVRKIRSRMNEVEKLIEAMKSKLPKKSQ